jgi:hypothetical protein
MASSRPAATASGLNTCASRSERIMTTPVITRRGLIQVGAALAASGIAVRKAGASGRAHGLALHSMVVEADPLDREAFARAAASRGLTVHRVAIDLAPTFMRFVSQWHQGEILPVGGLTHAQTLFYYERLAWDTAGMRVVFLGRHAVRNGTPVHALKGPSAAIGRFHNSTRWIDWRIAIANTLTEVPRITPVLKPVNAVRDAVVEGDPALFSWVIAPVHRRRRVLA